MAALLELPTPVVGLPAGVMCCCCGVAWLLPDISCRVQSGISCHGRLTTLQPPSWLILLLLSEGSLG